MRRGKRALTLVFESKAHRDSFIGWFLDGGGEYQWNDSREQQGIETLDVNMSSDRSLIEVTPYPPDDDSAQSGTPAEKGET